MEIEQLIAALKKDRATALAALTLAPIGFVQRDLIRCMVVRHFDALDSLAALIAKIDGRAAP